MSRTGKHDRDRVEELELGGGGDIVSENRRAAFYCEPRELFGNAHFGNTSLVAGSFAMPSSVKISRNSLPCCSTYWRAAGPVVKLGVQKLRARSFCHSSVFTAAASAFSQ